ncbi:SIMPL domain-containing protein [Pleionea sp. CnH1-48]|uniref:SIMPL domain-containing protein n=1 Tax=Pleionea sp. CnH1-48 TaxID=2954494 RepID=UPI0020971F6C|nr:SIMPL domain-containing protein [Pleionea sp. CnH1-48]MCO7225095.1 SIMPL domain-containing protein [Pleionea sp. CnH1-48]
MKHLWLVLILVAQVSFAESIPEQPHISVSGTGEVVVQPDSASISMTLEKSAPNQVEAKNSVDAKAAKLLQLFKSMGINKRDIKASELRLNQQYDYRNGKRKLIGYTVSRTVELTLRDVSKYSDFLTQAFEIGISNISNIRLFHSKEDELRSQAKAKAVAQIKKKAADVAAAFDQSLLQLYNVSERPLVAPVALNEFSDRGLKQGRVNQSVFEVGEITISETLYATYLIKNSMGRR